MSLVEQTIARLKREQAETGAFEPTSRLPRVTALGTVPEPSEEPASAVNILSIDANALRAAGYLPELERERQLTDQYRRIKRTLIDKALSGKAENGDPRILMVTSALPGDGKTFTSLNLSLSMSLERDLSVLLIDADVPKRHITRIFGLDTRPGLLDALADERVDVGSLVVPTSTRGFSILPAGNRAPDTAELLSSSRMAKLVASLCARNPRRILVLDSPPLLVTNEGRVLVKLAGQIVLVVRAGQTPRQAIQAAVSLFDPNQAGGVVLNQVSGASTEEYYGYGSYGIDGAQT